MSPNTMTIATNTMIANMDMASAFSQPQSKKCFTIKSQIISWMMAAIKPVNKAPKKVPTKVPTMTIQMASVNFAFSFPTRALPESQRTGESIIVLTIMCITNVSKLIAKFDAPPQILKLNSPINFIMLLHALG